jgi:cell wall-associated NlpC family hydrolase
MIRKIAYVVPVCFLISASSALADDVVDLAATLIGRPYVWGAEGPRAFDCSGLTQYVYQEFGIELPRRAVDQSKFGDHVRRLQPGDLLFFSTDSRQSLVTHVGLYEGHGMMIQASKRHGRVRRDSVEEPYWRERFMIARRVRDDRSDRSDRSSDRRRATVRVIERLAGALFKRPRGN